MQELALGDRAMHTHCSFQYIQVKDSQ